MGRLKQEVCYKGHPLNGDNLYVSPKGKRACRTCKKVREKETPTREPKWLRLLLHSTLPKRPGPPRVASCLYCGETFYVYSKTNTYCRKEECRKARQRKRWKEWKTRKEEAGVYRDDANKYQQAFRERTGYSRDYELRTKYGITLEQWLQMVDTVGGKCQICNKDKESLCLDHSHVTGKVRGVLCRACNRAIGQLGDSIEGLKKAYEYLVQTEGSIDL